MNSVLSAGADTTVASLELPPGNYMIWARISLSSSSGTHIVPCRLKGGGIGYGFASTEITVEGAVTLVSEATLSVPTTFEYFCSEDPGHTDLAFLPFLSAIQVGTLHQM